MKKAALVVLAVMALGLVQVAMAQNANGSVQIQAVKAETLTISATFPNQMAIGEGAADSDAQPLNITTTWNLKPGVATSAVNVCAGLTSAGLTGTAGDTIAAANVHASSTSTGTFAALNAGAGCGQTGSVVTTVNSYPYTNATRKNQTKADTIYLKIVGASTTLAADTYTGTVTVYALVTP